MQSLVVTRQAEKWGGGKRSEALQSRKAFIRFTLALDGKLIRAHGSRWVMRKGGKTPATCAGCGGLIQGGERKNRLKLLKEKQHTSHLSKFRLMLQTHISQSSGYSFSLLLVFINQFGITARFGSTVWSRFMYLFPKIDLQRGARKPDPIFYSRASLRNNCLIPPRHAPPSLSGPSHPS